MTTTRPAIMLAFGAVILGAMGSSYLHLSAWLRPWMPPGWAGMSYVAALSIDGLIIAPILARQIVGGPVPGMTLPLAQLMGVAASVYVNARWGEVSVHGATWADNAVGAAILPLFALMAEACMRATLAVLQAKQAAATATLAATVSQPKRQRVSRVTATGAAESVGSPAKVPTVGATPSAAELAARDGVSMRTAFRRLAAARGGAED